jgi:anti-anti-sigma factor
MMSPFSSPMVSSPAQPRRNRDRLIALVHAGRTAIVVDLKNIAYITSAGFHVLLFANRAVAEERQGKLALCGVTGEVRRLFQIGAFIEQFLICQTRADGIEMLRQ